MYAIRSYYVIVPMKKATLLVMDKDRDEALLALRSLGVLHVENTQNTTQVTVEIQNLVSRIDQAIGVLEELKADTKKLQPKPLTRDEALQVVDRIMTVITSYSIHYTKLYESVRQPNRRRQFFRGRKNLRNNFV